MTRTRAAEVHARAPVVECYSGFTYAQEPRAFTFLGQRREIVQTEHSWREPDGPRFRVRTFDGRRWDLAYDDTRSLWSLRQLT